MTNAEIIATNLAILIANGDIEEGETINYVRKWNKLGYTVRVGETHIAKFPIWMPKSKKEIEKEMEENDGKAVNRFKWVNTCWFSSKQVEPAKRKTTTKSKGE